MMDNWRELTLDNIYFDENTQSLTKEFGVFQNAEYEILKKAIQVEPFSLNMEIEVKECKCLVMLKFKGKKGRGTINPPDFFTFYRRELPSSLKDEKIIAYVNTIKQIEKVEYTYRTTRGAHVFNLVFDLQKKGGEVAEKFSWLINSAGNLGAIKSDLDDFFAEYGIEFIPDKKPILLLIIENIIYQYSVTIAFYKIEDNCVIIKFPV